MRGVCGALHAEGLDLTVLAKSKPAAACPKNSPWEGVCISSSLPGGDVHGEEFLTVQTLEFSLLHR